MGIAHHRNYFSWFEVGRCEFMRLRGLPYSVVEEQGVLFPVLSAGCRYRQPCRFDQEVDVLTRVGGFSRLRLTFAYEIRDPVGDRLLAEGETVHGIVNADGRPFNLRQHNPWLWRRLRQVLVVEPDPEVSRK